MATRLELARPSLGGFWKWWTGELRGLFPRRPWRPPVRREAAIVLYEGHLARIGLRRDRKLTEVGTLALREAARADAPPLPLAQDPTTQAILRTVQRSRLPVVLRLPAEMGLVAGDVLPASAERELGAIMAHKVDLLTPWSADHVYYDQRIDARRPDGSLEVSLVAIPRQRVAEARQRLAAVGLSVRGVDLVEDDPWAPPTVDLAHALEQPRQGGGLARVLAGLVVLAAAAAAAFAGYQYYTRQQIIAERAELLRSLEERVADMPELRTSLDALRGETRFVAERQAALGSPLVALEELSRVLPDSVWLTDITLRGNELTINGYADDASAVVALVEDSPYFAKAQFRSPSTREQVELPSGESREVSRFSLAATVGPSREIGP
ncbi:MAG: PilN domain-containing protein [Geminicoccaceae bacterium]